MKSPMEWMKRRTGSRQRCAAAIASQQDCLGGAEPVELGVGQSDILKSALPQVGQQLARSGMRQVH
jgi:hypothetical protein